MIGTAQPPLPAPRFHLSFSLPLLYHFHSISCFPFSVSAKLNSICISVPGLPVFYPVSYTQVTCLISHPASKPFISIRVCVCVCGVGVIRNHLVIFYSSYIESLLKSRSAVVFLFFVRVAGFLLWAVSSLCPTSRTTSNAVCCVLKYVVKQSLYSPGQALTVPGC